MTKTQKQDVVRQEQQLPATDDYADKYAGEGTAVDAQYQITPMARIVQANSPFVKRTNMQYIDGAQPGMIVLSNSAEPLVEGEEGILFQPCWFGTVWEVRTPKSDQGFPLYIGEYAEPQAGWEQVKNKNFISYKTPDGNVANEVHQHVGFIHRNGQIAPYAIKFGSTGIFVSKNFNGLVSGRKTATGRAAARFTFLYRMTVKSQTNQFGEWGQWNISPEGKASEADLEMGHALWKEMVEQKRTVEQDVGDTS
jgi:hypothetical protein